MNSEGSSSESDVSETSGDWNFEVIKNAARNRILCRRESITSVCTHPEEEAYVMVLQNKQEFYDNLKGILTMKDLCDVTFLVGKDRTPVSGIRTVIEKRSRPLHELILSFQENKSTREKEGRSLFKKTFTKFGRVACLRPNYDNGTPPSGHEKRLKIPMDTFDPETFQRLMSYIHNGTLTVDSSTVIGLLNAAFMYELPEVQKACWDFAMGCAVRTDNLEDLLDTSRLYIHHPMTIKLIKTLRRYADDFPDILESSKSLAALAKQVFEVHDARLCEREVVTVT